MKTINKMKKVILMSGLLMLQGLVSWAQSGTVSGTVTGADDGEGLVGVSVTVQNTTRGTITDVNGNYNLEASPDEVLVYSFVGYKTKTVEVGNRSTIDVTLEEDLVALQEVVVVGYGAVKKSDLTGSVSSVKSEDLTAFPALSAVQTLQGRAAGVQIQSNNGGQPGADYNIRIRGGTSINASSNPLIVVDGFVGGEMPPPEDIASIEILKDASATAIYGSRGANGVIMVTTKRGKAGDMRIEINSAYSLQNVLNRLDMLNADQFGSYIQEVNPGYTQFNANTDWQDEIYRQGFISNNQISFSGGNKDFRYYASGTYFDQEGVVLGSEYNRYSFNSNIDIQPREFLNVGINLYGRRSTANGVNTQEGSGGAGSAGIVSSAFRFNPDLGIYNDDNSFTISEVGDDIDNPYALGTQYNRERVTDRFQTNTFAELELLDWLKFKTTLGVTVNNWRDGQHWPTTLIRGAGQGGIATIEARKQTSFINENYFTANKNFNDHDLTLVGGYSFQKFRNEAWETTASGYTSNSSSFWGLDQSSLPDVPESRLSETVIKSYYTRFNYSYQGKYMLTFTARYDGASNFSVNKKWAFFPSGSIAWDMMAESFMQPLGNIFNQWKWRASYGLVGNQAIGPYQTLSSFRAIYASRNNELVNAIRLDNLANDNLTWETTAQFNVGADIGLLEGRLNLVADYYHMKTTDLLFERDLPAYVGVGRQFQNIGAIQNSGFEFTASSLNTVQTLKWNTDFNISFNRNKVLELPDNGADIFYDGAPGHLVLGTDNQVIRVGEPLGVFYGFYYDGVYQNGDEFLDGSGFEKEAGGEKFRDLNNDDRLDFDNDRTIIGDPNPNFIWSMNNSLSFKGFDLNVFFQGSQGNDMLSYTLMELDILSGSNNATTAALDRWTPTNPNTDVPKASSGRSRRISTRFIYDASYIRLKNVTLGYTLPDQLTTRLGLNKVRLSLSAQNLLTITRYPGLDPEVGYGNDSNNRSGNLLLGLDYGSYPNVNAFTFGVNVNL